MAIATHRPDGNPCARCGLPVSQHRVSHYPDGDPCSCGVAWEDHRMKSADHYFAGIDGEGQGRRDHKYVQLAWSNESGTRNAVLEAPEGESLPTIRCLDFILNIPIRAQVFAFAFNYDLTKILTDLPDKVLYYLFRPELRQREHRLRYLGPRPILWEGYELNLVGSKFSVRKKARRTVIWDIFKFYQKKFTGALTDWKVGEVDAIRDMQLMKDQRGDFDKLTRKEVITYCLSECRHMATLTRKLVEAHNTAGLKLISYYGAGSTASAMMKKHGIHRIVKTVDIKEMERPIAQAFFGGRFENSIIGPVKGPIYGWDISSAYPYQAYQLPCLECGSWRFTTDYLDVQTARHALVKYILHESSGNQWWAPFPFRSNDGSICYPSSSGGGWIWRDEFIAGMKIFNGLRFCGAWIYDCSCGHRPFDFIADYYKERLRIGKEGPGIVLKLGCNSVYGKLAQSIGGKTPLQSWIWAGMITSGTRAQILAMLGLHRHLDNMLMVATDGIYTRESIIPPVPINTNTQTEHNKPLGGWEGKTINQGMFAMRPGIYFPLQPGKDDVEQVRARGIGRGTLYQSWQLMVDAFERCEPMVRLPDLTRFHGAKSSISRTKDKQVYTRSSDYGQWTTRKVELSFSPMPKRGKILPNNELSLRAMPLDVESAPYERSLISPETLLLKLAEAEILEQPDGYDLIDYESASEV